jgi:hypothetical protein
LTKNRDTTLFKPPDIMASPMLFELIGQWRWHYIVSAAVPQGSPKALERTITKQDFSFPFLPAGRSIVGLPSA